MAPFSSPDSKPINCLAKAKDAACRFFRAHASVRPIEKVFVWGRNPHQAKEICELLRTEKFESQPIANLEDGISKADIISCATLSEIPLILGKYLQDGQHLDMVGAYRPHMREADNETIQRSSIFVDHYPGALKETGDIVIPVREGLLDPGAIKADLHELCAGSKPGRTNHKEITFFKSVGHAMEDLMAAELVYDSTH